jgi:hypothetical protein
MNKGVWPLEDRIFSPKAFSVDKTTGCWIWKRTCGWDGYGTIQIFSGYRKQLHRRVSRVVYEMIVGPIPEGKVLDHFKCGCRKCFNPFHVRPVSVRENSLRGDTIVAENVAKVACIRGHDFTPENTGRDANYDRYCKTCRRIS